MVARVRDFVARLINSNPGLLGLPNLLGHALVIGLALAVSAFFINLRNRTLYTDVGKEDIAAGPALWRGLFGRRLRTFYVRYLRAALAYCGAAFAAGAIGGVLLVLLEKLAQTLDMASMPGLAATIVPPLGLLILVAAFVAEVGLLGRQITEAEREWWSRLSALLLIAAIGWASALATVIYVPALFLAAGTWVRVALTSGWLGATVAGVLTGRRARPKAKGGGGVTLTTVATLLPPVFLAGLVGAVSLLAAYFVNTPRLDFSAGAEGYYRGMIGASFYALAVALLASYDLYWLANRFIDVNLFSLHAMYANRLIRCYLGASRPKMRWPLRWGSRHDPRAGGGAPSLRVAIPASPELLLPPDRDPNPATGFDLGDDIPMYDLQIGQDREGRTYWGPHLLVNTTLNLVAGGELAYRDRKGEAFVITPLHCGSKGVGYAEVARSTRENLTLGRAITMSGAAVDPNMKFYQSAALTAFLTIFNARLGYWMQNPLYRDWRAGSPRFGDRLWVELFGQTDGTDAYIHLSDGGHFENMGVYELIRRRCRYIVALDAGEDADAADDNLAELIRLCRIDFGVRIELDTRPFQAQGPDKLTRTHVAVGRVRYDDVDSGQMSGTIVYVKISLTGDEPPDLLKYARKDPRFPHQPTDLRQAFDEEQFECYRALGDHIARDVFGEAAGVAEVREALSTPPKKHEDYIRDNQRLFSAVRGRWAQPPANNDESYVQSAGEWSELMRDFREETGLDDLSHALYPETAATADRVVRHTVAQMLQVMEGAWIGLGLKVNRDLPMNRGWMNVFRRWANTDAFRRHWPAFRTEFSPDFVKFCEEQLHLVAAKPVLVRVPQGYQPKSFEGESLATLTREFAREWPELAEPEPAFSGVARPRRGLAERIAEAVALNPGGDPLIWLAVEAPSGHGAADQSPEKFPGGVFLISDYVEVVDKDAKTVTTATRPYTFELLAWVRRPRRSTRLGSRFLDDGFLEDGFLEDVKRVLRNKYPADQSLSLRVRYPKSGWGVDTDQELEMWRSFFAFYDFKPLPRRRGAEETVMELKF